MELLKKTAVEQHKALVNKEVSAKELVQASIDRIEKLDAELGSFNSTTFEMALDTAKLVDAEIKSLVVNAHAEAKKILQEHEKEWETLSQALIEFETLTGEEIKDVIAGKKIDKSDEAPVEEAKRVQSSVPEA